MKGEVQSASQMPVSVRRSSTLGHARYVVAANPVTAFAFVLLGVIVTVAVFGPWIAPYDSLRSDTANALKPPSWRNWFGTDQLGRDVLSRVLIATRLDLSIAIASVALVFVQAKDDHVLFFAPTSTFCMHPYQHANLPYDPRRDLNPIVKLSRALLVLAAPASLPAKDLKEFVSLVRAKPGELNYGMTPGFTEFVFEGFLREQGLRMSKVPYRDITQAPTDLGQDRIQILGVTHAVALAQIQAGRAKLLAVSAATRSDLAPGTPSVHEQGFPSLQSVSLIGAWGPPTMSVELRRRIAADMMKPLEDPDIVRRLRAASHVLEPAGPEQFAVELKSLENQVADIAKVLGVSRKHQ